MVGEKVGAPRGVLMASRVPAETCRLPPFMRDHFATRGFEILRAVKKGVFLVFLDGPCTHCVVVHGFPEVIVDSVDPHPLRFGAETFIKCGGCRRTDANERVCS